jgi:protein-S-isoprenylcysteine O-methyltransferase Ste14
VSQILRGVGWILCCIYATIPAFWLMIHPRVDFWRSRPGSPYRVLLPVWVGMWIVFGLVTAPWRNLILYESRWTFLPALILFSVGIWIYGRSSTHFSLTHLSGLPELRSTQGHQQLITSGLHNRVRHPIYLGHFCEMLAWSLGTGLLVCYALTGFAIVTGAIMIRLEDKELELRFGQPYREYRARVPAILPKIALR